MERCGKEVRGAAHLRLIKQVEIPEGKHVEEQLVPQTLLPQLLAIVPRKSLAGHCHLRGGKEKKRNKK
jgi:hypothetical protein